MGCSANGRGGGGGVRRRRRRRRRGRRRRRRGRRRKMSTRKWSNCKSGYLVVCVITRRNMAFPSSGLK